MILADTSVWIEHLRSGDPTLALLLTEQSILMHPCILGELACGNLRHRDRTLADLSTLPKPAVASDPEVLQLIERRHLFGRGIGWIDAHLLASALLSECEFWTLDSRLARSARALDLAPPAQRR